MWTRFHLIARDAIGLLLAAGAGAAIALTEQVLR